MKTDWQWQLLALLALCSLYLTHRVRSVPIQGRIISGTAAAPGQLPWQVILKKDDMDNLLCGGSIISPNWVLTAAHCTYGLDSIFLVFGSIDLDDTATNMTSTQMFIHPDYNASNLNNDISLIQLPTLLTYTPNIQPIALVSSSEAENSFLGSWAIIEGFGLTDDEYLDYSQVLLWAQVQIVNNSKCETYFGSNVVQPTTMCAVGGNNTNMSICSGDSGGPLIMANGLGSFVQIGINSFVTEDMCTEKYHSGYCRLTSYLDYISSVTGLTLS